MWETCFEHDKSVALQLIRRSLVGHLAQLNAESKTKGAMPPTTGKVTAEQLQRIIDICQDLDTDDVQAVLSVAQAVANAEATSGKERWSEIESAEKTIKLVMGGIKDSLGEMVGSSRRSGERAEVLEAEETQEMDAAWNQLLAAIPALSPGMLEACASEEPESLALEALTRRWLWRHTPAPGMVLMAASLLAPTKAGIPAGQRARVEQRLVDDYAAVFQAVARGHKGAWSAGAAQGAAQRWAARVVEYAGLVAVSEGQRSRVAQWRELVGLSRGMDGVYSPLCARVASDVLRGDSGCADLEHAEQGTAVAAANLLKGLGVNAHIRRRFLSGKPAAGASDGPSSTDQLPPRGAGEAAARSATVLFFVVGGITFEEAALVAAAARQHGGARRVLVGGTSISTAAGLAHLAGLA
ncbi:hypothetical protein GGI04_002519 [Coemansia thaxteri]|nr:hypothetical protein GGI04_002519 [Coemansia thaxteri]